MEPSGVSFDVHWLGTLVGVLGIAGLVATVPFGFTTYVTPASALILMPAFTLIGALVVPLASVAYLRGGAGSRSTVVMPRGYDVLLFVLGLVTVAVAAAMVINTGLSLRSCSDTRTDLALTTFIFDAACTDVNATITAGSLPLYRRPNFAFNLLWFQACRDELPIVIVLLIAGAAILAAGITTMVGSYNVRARGSGVRARP